MAQKSWLTALKFIAFDKSLGAFTKQALQIEKGDRRRAGMDERECKREDTENECRKLGRK